jgi:Cu-processing system permease protein
LILIAVTLFFGTFARPMMAVVFSSSVFMIGHWVTSLDSLSQKQSTDQIKAIAAVLHWLLPDFEKFNWRSAPIYSLQVPAADIGFATLYALAWVVILMGLTSLIFRRRDFV